MAAVLHLDVPPQISVLSPFCRIFAQVVEKGSHLRKSACWIAWVSSILVLMEQEPVSPPRSAAPTYYIDDVGSIVLTR
jgi:hypothetical protein